MNSTVPDPSALPKRVAILGGGISGLAAALRLETLCPEASLVLFESQDRLGGILGTHRESGYMVEQAADNFLRGPSAPWAERLTERLGLGAMLIPTAERNRGAHVAWHGELHPVPEGFQLMAPSRFSPILRSRLLSPWGKLRLCLEPWIREPKQAKEESLRQFATRRLGREAFERLVEPLVSGIYTADPDRLSVQAALPQMVQMAREHGSLYRAMQRRERQSRQAGQDRGARYSLFIAPRDGMSSWIAALASQLQRTELRLASPVQTLRRTADGRWLVAGPPSTPPSTMPSAGAAAENAFDAVVVALPVTGAARVLQEAGPAVAESLSRIPAASSAVVCLGYRADQLRRPLDAFGCVIPSSEHRQALAISYSSNKFPERAPAGSHLLRVFLGGSLHPGLTDAPDEELERIARGEVEHWLHASGTPQLVRVVRWPHAMPQYELGHLMLVEAIERQLAGLPGLALAGNYLRGVGVPQCVHSGEQAAEALVNGRRL